METARIEQFLENKGYQQIERAREWLQTRLRVQRHPESFDTLVVNDRELQVLPGPRAIESGAFNVEKLNPTSRAVHLLLVRHGPSLVDYLFAPDEQSAIASLANSKSARHWLQTNLRFCLATRNVEHIPLLGPKDCDFDTLAVARLSNVRGLPGTFWSIVEAMVARLSSFDFLSLELAHFSSPDEVWNVVAYTPDVRDRELRIRNGNLEAQRLPLLQWEPLPDQAPGEQVWVWVSFADRMLIKNVINLSNKQAIDVGCCDHAL